MDGLDYALKRLSDDEIAELTHECRLYKQGFYESKEEFLKNVRTIIYPE